MKRLSLIALLLLLPASHANPIVERSVQVISGSGIGSGVVITVSDRLYVLTAAHVVSDIYDNPIRYRKESGVYYETLGEPKSVTLVTRKGSVDATRPGNVVWYSERDDLALIRPDDATGLKSALLMEEGKKVPSGVSAWYCGSGGGLPFSLVQTIVNQVKNGDVIVNGEAWFGHSGSGVFIKSRNRLYVVGIVSRFTLNNPRSPVTAVGHKTIHRFLRDFQRAK